MTWKKVYYGNLPTGWSAPIKTKMLDAAVVDPEIILFKRLRAIRRPKPCPRDAADPLVLDTFCALELVKYPIAEWLEEVVYEQGLPIFKDCALALAEAALEGLGAFKTYGQAVGVEDAVVILPTIVIGVDGDAMVPDAPAQGRKARKANVHTMTPPCCDHRGAHIFVLLSKPRHEGVGQRPPTEIKRLRAHKRGRSWRTIDRRAIAHRCPSCWSVYRGRREAEIEAALLASPVARE